MANDKDIYGDGHGFRDTWTKPDERKSLALNCEAVDANGQVCPECHDTAPGDKLFVYFPAEGERRQRDGAFCSRVCHDVWYGITSYRKLVNNGER